MPTVTTQVDTTIDVDVDIEVYCNSCGDGMCNETDVVKTHNRQANAFRVNACPKCLKRAEEEGFDKGYEEGKDVGYNEGYEKAVAEYKKAEHSEHGREQ